MRAQWTVSRRREVQEVEPLTHPRLDALAQQPRRARGDHRCGVTGHLPGDLEVLRQGKCFAHGVGSVRHLIPRGADPGPPISPTVQ